MNLRGTIGLTRLNGLSHLHVYCSIKVDLGEVVNTFVGQYPRKVLDN